MPTKRMIVLANSYKKKPGRCVAGREIGEGNTVGDWLRPISDQPEGELLPRHMKVDDGSPLEVLDIVDVPIGDYADDKTQPGGLAGRCLCPVEAPKEVRGEESCRD